MRSFAEGAAEFPAQKLKASEIRRTLALLDSLPRDRNQDREARTA